MKHPFRSALTAVAAAALSCTVLAQTAGSENIITMVVPAAPGGTTDLAARMLAEPLGKAMGQNVIVDNRAGASGTIAAVVVKRAKPDGNTLLMQYSGFHVITPHVVKNAPWEAKDLTAVANVLSAPQVIVVREGLPVKTMADLIAYAKANPDKLTYASSGNGSLQHVTGEMLVQQAGIKMTHIPYKGTGPALQDLLGGRVDVTFGTPPPFMPHIQSGRLKVLAVTSKTRLPSLPSVPTAAEAGLPNLDATSWFGVFVPANTPQAKVDKLAADIEKVVNTPAFQNKATELGASADFMNPKEFADYSASELARWGKVVKSAKIEAD